jgi:predicted ATPase
MRIAISGCANTGKTTLVKNFLNRWPMYNTPKKTYRDVINELNLPHSSKTSDITQLAILNWMTEELENYTKDSHVIFDRCPLDNLVYTLVANEKSSVSDETAALTIEITKKALKNIDIIFLLRYDSDIKIINDGMRDTDISFIKETDLMFEGLYKQYSDHLEDTPFFNKEDCPAIIQIEGKTIDERISWIGEFINPMGDLIENESSILSPENYEMMEQMLKEQKEWAGKDNEFKKLSQQINQFKL